MIPEVHVTTENNLQASVRSLLRSAIGLSIKNRGSADKLVKHLDQNFQITAAFCQHEKVSGRIDILSIGVGSKNVSSDAIQNEKCLQLKDCHAEILARRGFLNFLHCELRKLTLDTPRSKYFHKSKHGKFRLNKNYELIIYCSKAPCGDCSITYDPAQEKIVTYSNAIPYKVYKKLSKENPNGPSEHLIDDKDALGLLRLKPVRKDFPLQKIGLNLSCSDKIMMWKELGVQGNLQSNFYSNIYPTKLLVNFDTPLTASDGGNQKNLVKGSIERGIEYRKKFRLKKWQVNGQGLEQKFWDKTYGVKDFLVIMVDGSGDASSTGERMQEPDYWIMNLGIMCYFDNATKDDPGFYGNFQFDIVDTSRGLRQGAAKKSKMAPVLASKLCDLCLGEKFLTNVFTNPAFGDKKERLYEFFGKVIGHNNREEIRQLAYGGEMRLRSLKCLASNYYLKKYLLRKRMGLRLSVKSGQNDCLIGINWSQL